MRLAYVLLVTLGCSSAPKSDTTTTNSTETPTEITATPAPATPEPTSTDAAAPAPTPTPASTPATTPASVSPASGTPVTKPSQTGGGTAAASSKPLYSCFSYVAAGSNTKRNNCMRTDDCPAYVEQAKSIKGIRDLTGCASVATVWCFHQVVRDDANGLDVCQPTVDDCKASRAAAVKSRESVDTDCLQR